MEGYTWMLILSYQDSVLTVLNSGLHVLLLSTPHGRQWRRPELPHAWNIGSSPWVPVGKKKEEKWCVTGLQKQTNLAKKCLTCLWLFKMAMHQNTTAKPYQAEPVWHIRLWKQGSKQQNAACSGNLWHYNYLLFYPVQSSLLCSPSRGLLGRTGKL